MKPMSGSCVTAPLGATIHIRFVPAWSSAIVDTTISPTSLMSVPREFSGIWLRMTNDVSVQRKARVTPVGLRPSMYWPVETPSSLIAAPRVCSSMPWGARVPSERRNACCTGRPSPEERNSNVPDTSPASFSPLMVTGRWKLGSDTSSRMLPDEMYERIPSNRPKVVAATTPLSLTSVTR